MDNSEPLVVSRLSIKSQQQCVFKNPEQRISPNYSRKLGPWSDPVTTRSDKHACGKPMLTDHDKQATGNREPANEMNKEDPTQGILVWLQPFTVIWRTWRRMCSHIPMKEWSQIRKVKRQKWWQKRRKIVHACFRKKTKEIYSADRTDWWSENSRARS